MIVLDTNIISELIKVVPEPRVELWAAGQPEADLFITTITEAELRFGIAILPAGRRRESLSLGVEEMFEKVFRDRILPFDRSAALHYAEISAKRRQTGRPISQPDAQIAAIARSRGAKIATRNTRDFEGCEIELINPWNPAT